MFTSCLEKQQQIIALFPASLTAEERYQKIMQLGKQQPTLPPAFKIPEHLVSGCQSRMYLHAWEEDGKIYFAAESDALISSGLASVLISVYNGESAETILQCPPAYLTTLGLDTSLSPSRANGLYSIHLRMKQEALKILVEKQKR